RGPQLKQSGFRTLSSAQVIKFRCAYGAQKYGVAIEACIQSRLRQGGTGLANGVPSNGPLDKLEVTVIKSIKSAQNTYCFATYFRPDTVAGKNRYLKTHRFRLSWGLFQLAA